MNDWQSASDFYYREPEVNNVFDLVCDCGNFNFSSFEINCSCIPKKFTIAAVQIQRQFRKHKNISTSTIFKNTYPLEFNTTSLKKYWHQSYSILLMFDIPFFVKPMTLTNCDGQLLLKTDTRYIGLNAKNTHFIFCDECCYLYDMFHDTYILPNGQVDKKIIDSIVSQSAYCPMYIHKATLIQRRWRWNKTLSKLWQIAEYYTKRKYNPENILNYVDCEN